jgi:hypothetical protein
MASWQRRPVLQGHLFGTGADALVVCCQQWHEFLHEGRTHLEYGAARADQLLVPRLQATKDPVPAPRSASAVLRWAMCRL